MLQANYNYSYDAWIYLTTFTERAALFDLKTAHMPRNCFKSELKRPNWQKPSLKLWVFDVLWTIKGFVMQRCIKTALKKKEACTQNNIKIGARTHKKCKTDKLLSETKVRWVKAKFSHMELQRKNVFRNNRKGLLKKNDGSVDWYIKSNHNGQESNQKKWFSTRG